MNPSEKNWFANWFNEDYDRLYPHRSEEQAQIQVEFVLREIHRLGNVPKNCLDLGCGAGRHLAKLKEELPNRAHGMDLSSWLLGRAQTEKNLSVTRGDLRFLPFQSSSFDLVTNFFTSFGYFGEEEDFAVLKEMSRIVKPKGYLLMDLMNESWVVNQLPREDTTILENGEEVLQTRYFKDGIVCKDKLWKGKKETKTFYERVRTYSLEKMTKLFEENQLNLVQTFGSEIGEAYDSNSSPRMTLLAQKD